MLKLACHFTLRRAILLTVFYYFLFSHNAQSFAQEIALHIDDIQSPAFSATAISAQLKGENLSELNVMIGKLTLQGKVWTSVRLTCPAVIVKARSVDCSKGMLQVGADAFPISFNYSESPRKVEISVKISPKEKWQFSAQFNRSAWQARVDILNGNIARVASWLPDTIPRPSSGKISGVVSVTGQSGLPLQATLKLQLSNLAFTDVSGLHAGEKIDGTINVQSSRFGNAWRWQAGIDWQRGEVFWQPFYFAKGGHTLQAQGKFDDHYISVDPSVLKIDGVGKLGITGNWVRKDGYLNDFELQASNLDLPSLYKNFLKPLFEKTSFSSLETQGKIDIDWRFHNRASERVDLNIHHVFAEDEQHRFALYDVNAVIPWRKNSPTTADIHLKGAQLLKIPLGEMSTPLQMNGLNFNLATLSIPVLDGKLNIADFEASLKNDAWAWQFSGGLTPVSMEKFSTVLELPLMQGTLSGVIPRIAYKNQFLNMDGALLFKVFDGTVVVKDLSMYEPLGRAPRLKADMDMSQLDLGLLTRAFSFGSMDGRIDIRVKDIELSNWKPVQFNAQLQSSPGNYRKKISQRAVQNISSLGGAGAAAAIQRSFLSVFEEFGYSKIGLSCVLSNGVCLMGGVEDAPQGYVIVKGGGIPAITVMGYNRSVNWDELLERLKRITQSNVKPVVQ